MLLSKEASRELFECVKAELHFYPSVESLSPLGRIKTQAFYHDAL